MKNKFLKLSSLLFIISSLSSCYYLKYSLMLEDGRRNELRTLSAKLVKAVSWREFTEVAKFMDDSSRDKGLRQLADQYDSLRIKDVKETNLDFDDDVEVAYQVIEIDGFSPPSYMVKKEFTQFQWTFSPSTEGWKITEITFSATDSSFSK